MEKSAASHRPSRFSTSLLLYMQDIKIQHTIFAMPFALVALAVSPIPTPTLLQACLLLVCLVSARSWAMGWNRILDKDIDQRNPRTQSRLIAAGTLNYHHARNIAFLFGIIFVTAAFALNSLAGWLSFPVLVILFSYSLLKRWTYFCHFYLGACLGLAPLAVSIALTGKMDYNLLLIAAAITFWTAGFDIIYALQDTKIDRQEGLHSIPAQFGPLAARLWSRTCFILTLIFLAQVGLNLNAGLIYHFGLLLIALLFVYQHILIGWKSTDRPDEISLNKAFFNSNALVSLIYCITAFIEFVFIK